MSSIFISYSREDIGKIKSLEEDLVIIGHDVWFDEGINGGQKWWDTILEQIKNSDIFIIGLSQDYLNSSVCQSELSYAIKLKKRIIPVKFFHNINLSLLPPELYKIHAIVYEENSKKQLSELSRCIMNLPPVHPLPEDLPKPPPVPLSYLQALNAKISTRCSLNKDKQWDIIMELKNKVNSSSFNRADINDLLIKFKERDDLYAKVDSEISKLLKTLNYEEITSENNKTNDLLL